MTNEELLARLEAGDNSVRELIIVRNRPLVMLCARRYQNTQDPVVDREELIACGEVGLIKAMNSYKPYKGTMFSTYAIRCITNEMLMILRQYNKNRFNGSLDDLANEKERFIDLLPDDSDCFEDRVHDRLMILSAIRALDQLTEKERKVMTIIIQNGGSIRQTDIAKQVGCSQPQISKTIRKAQTKLCDICEYFNA